MRTYLIAYDLAQPQSSRHAIAGEIMRLGQSWARPLEQTWYVRSEADEGELKRASPGCSAPRTGSSFRRSRKKRFWSTLPIALVSPAP